MKKGKYPKFSVGGYYSKNLKSLSGFLADNAFTTLTAGLGSNIVKQNQYDDTGFGRELGKNQAMKESFDSMQPLGKIGRKTGLISDTPEATGMNDAQYQEYQKWQPIATAGSKVGEAWATQGIGGTNGMFNMFKKKDKNTGGSQTDFMNQQRQNQFQPAENSDAYYNTIMANGGKMPNLYNMGGKQPCYNYGGMHQYAQGGINAEVEKQENTLNPDGSTNQYDGPSHDMGGIKTHLDPSTLIFSDRLKLGKKTFAQLNKGNNTSKEDKILNSNKYSKLSKSTAELMKFAKNKNSLDLFEEQENLKKEKVRSYAKKLGMSFDEPEAQDNPQEESAEFAKGGRFMGINPAHKGYCTPMTKSTCTPHRKALAMTLKKHHGFHANGGVQKFDGGGRKEEDYYTNVLDAEGQRTYQKYFNDASKYDPDFNPDNYTVSNFVKTYYPQLTKGYKPENQEVTKPSINNEKSNNWKGTTGDIGMFLANNMGNLYNLSRYNKPEVEKYDRTTPTYLDPTASVRDAKRIERNTFKKIKDASTGNAATALSNYASVRANTTMDIDKINRDYANANAGIANQFNMYNTGLSKEEVIANAMNRARNRSGQGEAIGSIGYNTANQMRDKRLDNMDQATLDLMMKYYNTPEFQRIMRDNKFKK